MHDRFADAPFTFAAMWRTAVQRAADDVFLVFEAADGTIATYTYGEFDHHVARVGGWLRSNDVGPGRAVHLALTNSPAFVAVWLATTQLGGWIVPSDPMGAEPELAGHIDRVRPAVGVCADVRRSIYDGAVTSNGATSTMRVIGVDESDTTLAGFGDVRVHDWPQPGLRDRAAVMFTSGTTGRPKGVQISQAGYAFAGTTMAAAAGLQRHHRQLVVLPVFHANAQYYSISSAIAVGASVTMMHTFSASRFAEQAARHRATHASLFAAPIRMILARGERVRPRLRMQHCWYAMNISDAQHATLADLLGCEPRQLYGMTETLPAVLTDHAASPVPSSMGFVTDGCEVQVQRGDGSAAGPDEVGEIAVRGEPGITLFDGYLDDAATTAASFRDGWFLTGDRASCDATGRFTFAGRRSDVLKVAGENVSTVEVEQVLSAHPGVLEAAVIGAHDEIRDEVPVAFVVAADPDAPPTTDELFAWCSQRLTKAKRPRSITMVSELPRTSVGKIRKFLLVDPDAERHAVRGEQPPAAATHSPQEAIAR